MDWREYRRFESAELLQTVDLNRVLEEIYHYQYRRREGKSMIFVKRDLDRKISTTTGKIGLPIWLDLRDRRNSGVVVDFIQHEEQCAERAAWDRMREIARNLYPTHWAYIEAVKKNSGSLSGIVRPAPVFRAVAKLATFDLAEYQAREFEHPPQPFSFSPAENFDFFLGRRITLETLQHPLFKGRFGNAQGRFGSNEPWKVAPKKVSPYVFKDHIIIPYWRGDEIVALEAKNRYTEAGYNEAIDRALENGHSLKDVRRNPSLFYKGSIKDAAWTSNIPENPVAIFLTEQPANALGYFQEHQHTDPDIERTIFITTGGTPTDAHYAIIHELTATHDIERLILGFDADPSGLAYSFSFIQNLPFNQSPSLTPQKYDIKLRANVDKKMELSFYSMSELTSTAPNNILDQVEKLQKALGVEYPFEGDIDIVRTITVSNHLCTFVIPFSPKNAELLFNLTLNVFRTRSDVFTLASSWPAKDWNDKVMNVDMELPSPSRLLFDQPENRNQIFITPRNYIIFHQQYVTIDHDPQPVIGEIKPFYHRQRVDRAKNLIQYDFVMQALQQLQDDLDKTVPLVDDQFFQQAVRRSIVFNEVTRAFERNGQILAHIQNGGVVYAQADTDAMDSKVIGWMSEVLASRGNPNMPALSLDYNLIRFYGQRIGEITPWFTFKLDTAFSHFDDDKIGRDQLALFLAELAKVRQAWQLFREKYTDPIQYVHSSDLILAERDLSLFQYDDKTGALTYLPKETDVEAHSFNRFFYKALESFAENGGVFYGYIRLVRMDSERKVLFYRRPDFEIGRLIDHEGKVYYALYPEIPAPMAREMQLFSLIPEASPELISRYGVNLIPTGLNGRIREKEISMTPYPYLRFFDEKGKDFVPLSKEKLKGLATNLKELYMDAYMWHLSHNTGDKVEEQLAVPRDRVFERSGKVYFNKIEVAKYNVQTDRLDMLVPASPRFFQMLAIIERNQVKTPGHRQYMRYLTQGDESKISRHVASSEIEAIHKRISQRDKTGDILIVDKQFELRTIGKIDDKMVIMNEEYLKFSEAFREAMMDYASRLHRGLEWRKFEAEAVELSTSVETSISTIDSNLYSHSLRFHSHRILQAVLDAPVFKDKLIAEGNELYFQFPTGEGETKFKFDQDWSKVKGEKVWLSKQPIAPKVLVLTQDPKQAVLYYQNYLPDSSQGNEMFVSPINMGIQRMQALVTGLVARHNVKEIRMVGDRHFIPRHKEALSSAVSIPMVSLPLFAVEQTTKRVEKELSSIEPDGRLQPLLEGLPALNILNLADGLMIFPLRSDAAPSRSVLGRQLYLSSDTNALWYSQELSRANRVVLTPNVEEAFYYIYLNRPFVSNDCVIAFQNTVSPDQAARLDRELSIARFHRREKGEMRSHIFVANTRNLSEQLLDRKFKVPFNIERPLREATFREDFLVQAGGFEKVESDLLAVAHRRVIDPPGKKPAPMIEMPGTHHEEHIRPIVQNHQRL